MFFVSKFEIKSNIFFAGKLNGLTQGGYVKGSIGQVSNNEIHIHIVGITAKNIGGFVFRSMNLKGFYYYTYQGDSNADLSSGKYWLSPYNAHK